MKIKQEKDKRENFFEQHLQFIKANDFVGLQRSLKDEASAYGSYDHFKENEGIKPLRERRSTAVRADSGGRMAQLGTDDLPKERQGYKCKQLIHYAAGSTLPIFELVHQKGIKSGKESDIAAQTREKGETMLPIHYAIMAGKKDIVVYCKEHGTNIEAIGGTQGLIDFARKHQVSDDMIAYLEGAAFASLENGTPLKLPKNGLLGDTPGGIVGMFRKPVQSSTSTSTAVHLRAGLQAGMDHSEEQKENFTPNSTVDNSSKKRGNTESSARSFKRSKTVKVDSRQQTITALFSAKRKSDEEKEEEIAKERRAALEEIGHENYKILRAAMPMSPRSALRYIREAANEERSFVRR